MRATSAAETVITGVAVVVLGVRAVTVSVPGFVVFVSPTFTRTVFETDALPFVQVIV